MTEEEFLIAVDIAVKRWGNDRTGQPLLCRPFARAESANCHANADSYVALYGGDVTRGFLVQHPHGWTNVWVMPHSVVRVDETLIDVTLDPSQLRGIAFFAVDGPAEGFVDWAKRYPRETRPAPQHR